MLLSMMSSEWMKLRKSNITPIILTGPFIGLVIGLTSNLTESINEMNEWTVSLIVMNLTYALLFLPLITGVLASLICRYEHQAGGWKQLLSLPVHRTNVFLSKYIVVMILVLVMQTLYLGAIFAVGMIKGYTDHFPMIIVVKSIFGGWIATFPLVALQLWLSTMWKSFAAPFACNIFFTLPTILVVNSERFGPYYPWAQPFSMMYIDDSTEGVFFVPWDQLLTVVGGSFILFFFGGLMYFRKKAI